jgi:drug/metabolite transporter (DMT)-like permease
VSAAPVAPPAGRRAVLEALAAAALFGIAAPLTKLLVYGLPALQLAGLLYLGAGLAMLPFGWRRGAVPLDGRNRLRVLGAVVCGGVLAPVFLVLALRIAPATIVSLLLTLEIAATAALGALFFHDRLGGRGWLGVGGVLAAGVILAWSGGSASALTVALVATACLLWGLDNNLTALVDAMSPARLTLLKGAVAGLVNLGLAALLTPAMPGALALGAALAIGAVCYGASLLLYIRAAQRLGAVRAHATFATAPFFGIGLAALLFVDTLSVTAVLAMGLAGVSVFTLLRDRHSHRHHHEALDHEHSHRHDDGHHQHAHDDLPGGTRHSHRHQHAAEEHAHPHVPDLHHRHAHREKS